MDELVSLCARRGFIFPSGELYGGINGFWDYGPLGVELKNNLKALWWQRVVRERDDVEGIDSAIVDAPAHLGGVGSRPALLRPDGRLQGVQEALPRRPARRRAAVPGARGHLASTTSPRRATST